MISESVSMQDQEEVLLAQVRQGDQNAVAEYLEVKRPQLQAFIDRQLGPALRRKVDVEDIFQEVSIDCVRAVGDVDLKEREPFNWFCQQAERRVIDAYRKYFGAQKRDASKEMALGNPGGGTQEGGLINLLVASMTSPSQAFSRQQKEFRLLEKISELPEEQSEAIRLRYVQGVSTREIAELLGKTDGAVRVMLTRTIRQLSSDLGVDTTL